MKRVSIFMLMLLLIPVTISSQKMGLGIIIGDPIGLNFIANLDAQKYLSIAAGWSPDAFNSHFDLNIKYDLKEKGLYWYWGAGVLFKFIKKTYPHKESETEFNMGVRIPFGLEYILPDINLAFFAELVPGITLVPSTDFMFGGAIGIRYYFK